MTPTDFIAFGQFVRDIGPRKMAGSRAGQLREGCRVADDHTYAYLFDLKCSYSQAISNRSKLGLLAQFSVQVPSLNRPARESPFDEPGGIEWALAFLFKHFPGGKPHTSPPSGGHAFPENALAPLCHSIPS